MWIPALLGLVALVGASAFYSGSEVALFALNRIQLRRVQQSTRRAERRIAALLDRPADVLATILVGNTLVNVGTAALVTSLLIDALPEHPDVAAPLAIVFDLVIVLVFGEVLPKTAAIRMPLKWARLAGLPLVLMQGLFRPVVMVLSATAVLILRWLGMRPSLRPGGSLGDSDLRHLFESRDEEIDILAEERRIARRIFEFSTARAAEVMTPRVDIRAVDRHISGESLREVIRASKHARLPVYEGNLDEIIGFISAKQYLLDPEASLDELLNPVLIVPEQKRVSDLFHEIQRQAISLVVVVDEYGHTAGLITKEDLVEEIVGEIHDEYDVDEEPITQLGPGRLLVGGLVPVGDLAEALDVRIESEAVTLNGLLAESLGRIPVAGEVVERGRLMFQVGEVRRHRVVRCVVRLLEVGDGDAGGGRGGSGMPGARTTGPGTIAPGTTGPEEPRAGGTGAER